MGSRFEKFIEGVAEFIAPTCILRGNVIVILRKKNDDQGNTHPVFECREFRPKNIFNRFGRARGFSFKDIDDLICILQDVRNFSHEELSEWIS